MPTQQTNTTYFPENPIPEGYVLVGGQQLVTKIRAQRNQLLKESDWVMFSDVNVTNKQAWLNYRQALRDVPQNFTNFEDVIWPTKPE